eukprot:CAMPEP_0169417094 /NCGR_PEP_ID=MMETSP1017-20121227/63510_1 /TAXON_ID=342587 /ORGANISM="Karlodinium micrum, Strain CCMP2283" /LENGTH=38 /DNA_ID= /DNA_START= /DNA_END= /DNA_ORIENTATION=
MLAPKSRDRLATRFYPPPTMASLTELTARRTRPKTSQL